ncbi:unnamed protein product, partial [Ectocarpus sp. 12 AP-2014]
ESGEATEAVARSCCSVGFLFNIQGKCEEAGQLNERSFAMPEKALGPDISNVAASLNNRGKYAEAEPLYERSQALREKVLGSEHP